MHDSEDMHSMDELKAKGCAFMDLLPDEFKGFAVELEEIGKQAIAEENLAMDQRMQHEEQAEKTKVADDNNRDTKSQTESSSSRSSLWEQKAGDGTGKKSNEESEAEETVQATDYPVVERLSNAPSEGTAPVVTETVIIPDVTAVETDRVPVAEKEMTGDTVEKVVAQQEQDETHDVADVVDARAETAAEAGESLRQEQLARELGSASITALTPRVDATSVEPNVSRPLEGVRDDIRVVERMTVDDAAVEQQADITDVPEARTTGISESLPDVHFDAVTESVRFTEVDLAEAERFDNLTTSIADDISLEQSILTTSEEGTTSEVAMDSLGESEDLLAAMEMTRVAAESEGQTSSEADASVSGPGSDAEMLTATMASAESEAPAAESTELIERERTVADIAAEAEATRLTQSFTDEEVDAAFAELVAAMTDEGVQTEAEANEAELDMTAESPAETGVGEMSDSAEVDTGSFESDANTGGLKEALEIVTASEDPEAETFQEVLSLETEEEIPLSIAEIVQEVTEEAQPLDETLLQLAAFLQREQQMAGDSAEASIESGAGLDLQPDELEEENIFETSIAGIGALVGAIEGANTETSVEAGTEPSAAIDAEGEAEAAIDAAVIKHLLAQAHEQAYPAANASEATASQLPKAKLTPELTRTLLSLLRALGYEDPQAVLLAYARQHDIGFILQAIQYMYQLMDESERKEIVPQALADPAAATVADDDRSEESVVVRIGRAIIGSVWGESEESQLVSA